MVGEVQLSDVAEIIMGQSPPGSTYNESGVGLPFFQGVRDFNYRYPSIRVFCSKPTRVAKPGDILFSVRAPIGRVNIAEVESSIGRGLSIIRARSHEDHRFIEFVLRSMEQQWQVIEGGGSVFGNATKQDLSTLSLPWPGNSREREAIACILGALDDKIELNRRINQTLEDTASAIFNSWFIEFDPVVYNAAQAGNPIPERFADTAARYREIPEIQRLPQNILDLFPDEFEDSELGKIPKGWRVKNLGDLIVISRNSLLPNDFPEEIFELYSIPAYDAGQIPTRDTGASIKSQKFILQKECVLVSKLNPKTPRVWLPLTSNQSRQIASTEFLVCAPNANLKADRNYLYCLVCNASFSKYLTSFASGTSNSHQRVRQEDFLAYKIPIPTTELLKAFSSRTKPPIDRTLLVKDQSQTLATLRDTLLPKLISGELRVPDAERIAERYA